MYDNVSMAQQQVRASGDLTGSTHRAVELTGTDDFAALAGAGTFYGVLATDGRSGEHVSVSRHGSAKIQVGAAVTPGDYLVVSTGGLAIAAASGAALGHIFGRARFAAASGSIARFDFERLYVTSGGAFA